MMSSLAELALEHARLRLAGLPISSARPPKPRPTSAGKKIDTLPPVTVTVRSLDVVVTGPVNHFMFLEGRAWAIEMVKSLRASSAHDVIYRLARAAQHRPASYAAGIKSVIDQLEPAAEKRRHDASVLAPAENLTNQG
ncbi:hypothetical protein ABQX22_18415 [Xanthomonas sp. WHRI 1810A]|uniref:hypothetical protein n=1 Tax=Xanthomonas sp. WHRI 1810A TaxID=3161565 RepID=UPI0032E8B97F